MPQPPAFDITPQPTRTEPSPRWIRVRAGDRWVADSRRATAVSTSSAGKQ